MSDSDEMEIATIDEEVNTLAQSLAEKMQIAKNVVMHCERMQKSNNASYSELENVKNYTGVCEDTIILADMAQKLGKTFTEWFEDKKLAEPNEYCFTYGSIRSTVLELYTQKAQVVTKDKLIKALLSRRCIRVLYEESRLKKDILRHGFTWKRLPGTKKTILVEKTEQTLKRMEYLTKIKSYREAGRTIVYADASYYYYQLTVSPQYGLLHMGLHGLNNDDDQCLVKWTQSILIDVLPVNSVVVLKDDPRYKKKIPTPFTSKSDMIKWLSERNIPHDPNLHRADLYAIIKKSKKQTNSDNSVHAIIKSHGHDIVYRPEELKNLDYLDIMWPGVPTQRCKTDTIVKMKEKMLQDWQNLEKVLINREEAVFQEDILLEAVVDKLLTLAKYGELTAADLEECDDEHPDEYYARIIID